MRVVERSLQEIGKSLLVSLPKDWTKALNLRKGSRIKMIVGEGGSLSIAPEFAADGEPKTAVIEFDEHLPRRFFREYFGGNEKITILLKGAISETERKDLYSFLKKFMNVQAIEETREKIVIKCFKIDELSIEECLKRMYFLSISMMDEVSAGNDKVKLMEMEDTLTKFYYMLVMQVRRFFSEGKFTEQNQIPLIRALDCRMIAEKIERIADILKRMDDMKDRELIRLLGELKGYYSSSFSSFISDDYGKALKLRAYEKKEREGYEKSKARAKKSKDIPSYMQANGLLQIMGYAKEISMLVR